MFEEAVKRPSATHIWYNPNTQLVLLGSWRKKRKYLIKNVDIYRVEFENGNVFDFEHYKENFFDSDNDFELIGTL